MLKGSAVIGQSGGPTVVINQSLVGYIEEAVEAEAIDRVLGARHGVQGMMEGDLVDLGGEPADVLEAVAATPAAAQADDVDLRQITGDWVNMRQGPGTGHAVLDTLPRGTEAMISSVAGFSTSIHSLTVESTHSPSMK